MSPNRRTQFVSGLSADEYQAVDWFYALEMCIRDRTMIDRELLPLRQRMNGKGNGHATFKNDPMAREAHNRAVLGYDLPDGIELRDSCLLYTSRCV